MVDSVVKGDFRAFEVPLSDIGPLYFTCNPGSVRINLVFCRFVPINSEYMIKKELAGYSRVPGSSDQKTDFGRFGYHPNRNPKSIILKSQNEIESGLKC